MNKEYEIFSLGDHGITLRCGHTIELAANGKMAAMADWLKQQAITGIRDIVPVYSSITIIYDVYLIRKTHAGDARQYITEWIEKAWDLTNPEPRTSLPVIRIPVCYEDAFAVNKSFVMENTGLEWDEIVSLHTSRIYQVCMVGFLPGFPYLALLPELLKVPRKETPRTSIAQGSITICDRQTGIFPITSPGGWAIIGRTPIPIFDGNSNNPCLLSVGDQVQFFPISSAEFSAEPTKPANS